MRSVTLIEQLKQNTIFCLIFFFFLQPDYYDALDYESKRQKTPRSEKRRGSGYPLRSPSAAAASGSGAKMR
jgi:hypothetical protein